MQSSTVHAIGWFVNMRLPRLLIFLTLVIGAIVCQSYPAFADTTGTVAVPDFGEWLRTNALAIAVIVYHLGYAMREFEDTKRRLKAIEDAAARKDVVEEQFNTMLARFDRWDRVLGMQYHGGPS